MAYELSRDELVEHLREQMDLLRASGTAFDAGGLHHAKPLATVLRVMLHDTDQSASVLKQLGVKDSLRFMDSAEHINPRNLAPTPGLVMMQMTTGVGGSYVPPLANLAPSRMQPPLPFEEWWLNPVTRDSHDNVFRRKDYVQTVSNKEGGAHVSENLPEKYAALTRNNSLGWMYFEGTEENSAPFDTNVALPSVRQIAFEVERTVEDQLGGLLR
jgi:hypothetical protein